MATGIWIKKETQTIASLGHFITMCNFLFLDSIHESFSDLLRSGNGTAHYYCMDINIQYRAGDFWCYDISFSDHFRFFTAFTISLSTA